MEEAPAGSNTSAPAVFIPRKRYIDHFRMLCLFPTGSDDSAFSFSNRVSARCRGRKLTLTDVAVPLRGGDMLYGCLIQLEMPRAPLSRFRMVGSTIADEEETEERDK